MKMGFWIPVVFLGCFYVVGFGLLGYGLYAANRTMSAAKWPIAQGTILDCQLTSGSDGDGGTTYQVTARYSYSVGGREYTGNRIAYGYSGSSHRDGHKQLLSRLKECESVEVRYDPFSPEESVLSYGLHRSIRFVLVFAVTWLLFVIGFSALWWIGMGSDNTLLENLVTR